MHDVRLAAGSGCRQLRASHAHERVKYQPAQLIRVSGTDSIPSRSGWLLTSWRSGTPGRRTGSKPFSAPHRPSKDATAFCRKCLITSGACPSSATRCGRCCITSMVALWMARRQRLGFSSGRFRISLKRCYPISRPYLNRGGKNARLH
jgi:hypothetical protein